MHLTSLLGLASIVNIAYGYSSSNELDFLTKLVEDARDHQGGYFMFYRTGTIDVPAQFTSLAGEVGSTGDAYTTLLNDGDLDITLMYNFAKKLPWYDDRLEDNGIAKEVESELPSSANPGSVKYIPAGLGLVALGMSLL